MSIKIKKKTLKIIIITILIIAIAVFWVIVSRVIINENKIKQTEEKLSKIDVKELEQSLIEELKNTSLNVNTSSFKTFFGTEEDFFNESNENKALGFSVSLHYKEGNPFKDYVSAYIMPTDNSGGGMVIPCFKIVCDNNNNNFKYILYQSDTNFTDFNMTNVVKKILNTKYGIVMYNAENDKYTEKFIVEGNKKYKETMEIYINLYDDDIISIVGEINSNLKSLNDNQLFNYISDNKKVSMSFFGIVDNSETNKEENEVSSTNLVIPSDNFYEMRFNLSIPEFCNNYNKAFKEIYSKYTDESFNSVLLISEDTFTKSSINNSQTGLEIYLATFNFKNDANYHATIAIHVEPNTQNIVAVAVMSDYNSYIKKNDFQTFITKCIIPSAIRGINKDMTTSEAENLMKRVSESKKGVYFKDNICCQIFNNKTSSTFDFMLAALSDKMYNKLFETQNSNGSTANNSTITSKSTIKDGTYFKKLTSTEKEEGIVSLGDIKIVIKDKNIEFYDNSSQIALQGIYTIENNKIVGTYTTATYYSYDKLESVTETIEDRFEFEIKENNTLYDTMGYGQFLGKCLQRNATYEIVE